VEGRAKKVAEGSDARRKSRHLLSAVGATGVPVARVSIATANAGFKIDH